jgi:hypothetical protein
MMKFRLYILPIPNIEMPMTPTDFEFKSESSVNDLYGEEIELTILRVL